MNVQNLSHLQSVLVQFQMIKMKITHISDRITGTHHASFNLLSKLSTNLPSLLVPKIVQYKLLTLYFTA